MPAAPPSACASTQPLPDFNRMVRLLAFCAVPGRPRPGGGVQPGGLLQRAVHAQGARGSLAPAGSSCATRTWDAAQDPIRKAYPDEVAFTRAGHPAGGPATGGRPRGRRRRGDPDVGPAGRRRSALGAGVPARARPTRSAPRGGVPRPEPEEARRWPTSRPGRPWPCRPTATAVRAGHGRHPDGRPHDRGDQPDARRLPAFDPFGVGLSRRPEAGQGAAPAVRV